MGAGEVDHHEPAAAWARDERDRVAERARGGDGRVDRVAAALEDLDPGAARGQVHRRDGAAGAHGHRLLGGVVLVVTRPARGRGAGKQRKRHEHRDKRRDGEAWTDSAHRSPFIHGRPSRNLSRPAGGHRPSNPARAGCRQLAVAAGGQAQQQLWEQKRQQHDQLGRSNT